MTFSVWLVQREARAEGSVDKNVYWQYLTAWSPFFAVPLAMLAAAVVERCLQVMHLSALELALPCY